MKQVLSHRGQVVVKDVPAPIAGDNEVLVQVYYSCISSGTETSSLKNARTPLYRKALRQPQKVKKLLRMIQTQGVEKTVVRVKNKLDVFSPIGCSVSGIVLEAGKDVKDVKQGDAVACAGANVANHAEFILVPRNLLVRVPENAAFDEASTVTLGSIAMQGIRRADPGLGDFTAVIGLGVLGQMASQMLRASGCRVVGIDIDQRRIDKAVSLGLDRGLNPATDDIVEEAIRYSGGHGVDSVLITASTETSDVINLAMEMCRKKGKVVVVGAVGLNLKREDFYKKELDVLISTSYGPGRYDEKYERGGCDYPYAYVRWTENRNMEEYLRLVAENRIAVKPLIEKVYSVDEAAAAYGEVAAGAVRPLITLLEYNKESIPERKVVVSENPCSRGRLNVALIGAGNIARQVHLPNLRKLSDLYNIYAIVSKTGSNAEAMAKRYGARYATTDFGEVLKDGNVDIVVITTRHHLHARMAIEAARAGKGIFLEKPLAVSRDEAAELIETLEETRVPFTVGFNRRFSDYAGKIKEIVRSRLNPMVINYRMNAGFIPREHWVHTEEGGGRNIAEACHIYDIFTFFTESEVASVSAVSIDPKSDQYARNDNFVATIKYRDGSIGNLVYTALGTTKAGKEQMEVFCDGNVIRLDDYRKLTIFGKRHPVLQTRHQEKGLCEELAAFARSVSLADGYPIPLWQLTQATEISLEVERQICAE